MNYYVKKTKYLKIRDENGDFPCEKCGHKESSVKYLKQHIREAHSIE
ncbi:hypothetical protein KAR91_03505 [Candidatus Pacearchaeota archaeon]|nr:hypothetical protein [Candidatus Pacearchaeota archaeon]